MVVDCLGVNQTLNFCPECGAHLLPNGDFEPRGKVVGEAWVVFHEDGFIISVFATPAGWPGAVLTRVLLVRPANEEASNA